MKKTKMWKKLAQDHANEAARLRAELDEMLRKERLRASEHAVSNEELDALRKELAAAKLAGHKADGSSQQGSGGSTQQDDG